MIKSRFYFIIVILLSFSSFFKVNAQLSKTHYLPPITSDELIENQYIYISTPKRTNVAFKITPIGQPANQVISGVVSNANPFSTSSNAIGIQLYQSQLLTSSIIRDKGYIIEADDVIYVSVRMISVPAGNSGNKNQAASLVSKGISAKGTEFRMGAYANDNPRGGHLNFISVMATEDNTDVTFDDLTTGITIDNYTLTGTNFTVNLNEGESYIVAVSNDLGGNPNHLLGTLVKSTKEIVVNSGSATGSFFGGSNTRDYGMDQIVGADKIGTEYIFVKGDGQNDWENILIVAHENNTTIEVNGTAVTDVSNTPLVLNKGEWHVIEGDSYTSGNMYVKTSKPAFAYQGVGFGTNAANQGLFFVPPLSCDSKGDVDNISEIQNIGSDVFDGGITVVTNAGSSVKINGQDITSSSFVTTGPNNVSGIPSNKPQYVTYKVTGLTGNISVTSDGELYCAYFNRNGAATSGSFYSGFLSAPEINFNTTVNSLGNCIPNVTLSAANTSLYDDGFKWEYYNENTATWELRGTPNQNTYIPVESEPGRYRLVGKVVCKPGEDFISTEIPVSICPDDIDGDLIIDNLDADLDNDGILNCDESQGNININLTNVNAASALNPLNNNNIITTSSYTSVEASNSLIGDANGNFTSTVNSATNSNAKYDLSFSQNINFIFKQNDSENHTVNNSEYFIIKIGPNNKNVTLLDPDDQLLVNTSFDLDQDFVSGVTNFSGSEIWFKYKADINAGNSTFKFLANQVNQITFEHKSTGLTSPSTYNGNIEITCFALDSDGDGIENSLDIDSDNDGIPDFYESVALAGTSLTNNDTNLDGLDDVFDTVASNTDSDNDGIPNYLDLDSDNDGIYDLAESGFTATDANNDGIIDNANAANVGTNGYFNSLETAPDSGLTLTAVRNLDANAEVVANRDNLFDFVDLDADGDDCFDVIEAGFTGNGAGLIAPNPLDINANGLVNNSDGYTTPNSNYSSDAPVVVTKFENAFICENTTDTITIQSTADGFQWEESTNGTNWSPLTDNGVYSGTSTSSLQITNTPLTNNNYQYRVVLTRTGNSCSKTSNPITLTVHPLPNILSNPATLDQCISVSNTNPTVNLTNAEISISNTTNLKFEYYEDINATTRIANPTSYPVQVNTQEIVFVRVISNKGCFDSIVELNINVGQVADNGYNNLQPPVCDDFDGTINSDTDKITNFMLDKTTIENGIAPPSNTEILYFENIQDRANTLNNIDITNFRNDITKNDVTNINRGIQFPIYYKIVSTVNNNCQGLGQFMLQINEVPSISATTLAPISECDTGNIDGNQTNGSNQEIDLTVRENDLFSGTGQNQNNYSVSYYKTETAASIGDINSTDYISNPTKFKNDVPTGFSPGDIVTQTIYVRVQNTATGCANPHSSFDVIINPAPTVSNVIQPLQVCDIGAKDGTTRNGLAQNINVSVKDDELVGAANVTNFIITYHKTQTDLEDLNSTGIDKTSYESDPNRITVNASSGISEETLLARIVNKNTGCVFNQATITIFVIPEPNIPLNISDYTDCDNTTDSNADDSNGINGDISLKNKIPEILANYQPTEFSNFSVTFYTSLADAESGNKTLAIDENMYENKSNNETIFVRVEDIKNMPTICVNTKLSFKININSLPSFMVMGEENVDVPQIICLNDLPLTLEAENPVANYNYEWKDQNGTTIGMNQTQDIISGGKYTVTATDQSPTSIACSRTRTIVVKESNIATLEPSFITIIDESNNIGNEDKISVQIDTITNNLGAGKYQFALRNNDNGERTPIIGYQDEPLFENLEGGIYTVIVNDKNGCSPETELQISVIQFPKFFTPNGDGKNDSWVVKGANRTFYPNSSINIFNRYGKLIAKVPIDGQGWNGTYQGKTLPPDDYWYSIQLIPADTSKPTISKKGNFSLVRR